MLGQESNNGNGKVLLLDDLMSKLDNLRRSGKVVVQTHGVFDLIHPGIIKHLNEAKTQGDVLIVTVIKDKDVRRGSGRPVFPEELRLENVAALHQVDYVCLVDDEIPFQCLQTIKPDVFAKGQTYKERDKTIHRKIFEEERDLFFGKTKLYETTGFSFSSSKIINNFLDIYPPETKKFLESFSQQYDFYYIADALETLKNLKVLLIGDGIIDEYHYCESMGKSAKAHLIVSKYLNQESFPGGAFAIANHLAGICDNIHLISLLGAEDSREDFIRDTLKSNVSAKFFYRKDGPTIIKKRYLNQYLNQKLFEINYLNDRFINGDNEAQIIDYLIQIMGDCDLVLVSDFGHGFITNRIIGVIETYAKVYAVNAQTNSANAGYNLITKYDKPNFVCLDEPELRLSCQEKFAEIELVAKNVLKDIEAQHLIVTLGKHGSLGVNNQNEICRTPIFSSRVVDTVGAGDAFFAFTAPCFAREMPLDLVSFIGNAVGALAVQIICNKKPVEKPDLLEFIHTILR
ncbi:MAG: adenylyltransferase/cytidyltransferase family protein [Candidatus Schekmanbacteria bacterium]|nr:adenylyltransferase/cytidyltransferase family protein [Candidatus Schekmanbacteria bacterium]